MIKNFSIFKNHKKEKETHPDYTISAKVTVNNIEEFKEIGAVYLKDTQKGEKYFSCSLAKTREYNGKTYSGYVIVDEVQYEKMKQVYEDYLIKQRNPDYPTPTEVGLDMVAHKKMWNDNTPITTTKDQAFDIKPEDLDVKPEDIPF